VKLSNIKENVMVKRSGNFLNAFRPGTKRIKVF